MTSTGYLIELLNKQRTATEQAWVLVLFHSRTKQESLGHCNYIIRKCKKPDESSFQDIATENMWFKHIAICKQDLRKFMEKSGFNT